MEKTNIFYRKVGISAILKKGQKPTMVPGLTLMETLITIIIIGIVSAAVIINFDPIIGQGENVEAKTQLAHLKQLQDLYKMENSRYADNIEDLGFNPGATVEEGGIRRFKYYITEASNTGFVARAEKVTDNDNDGSVVIFEISNSDMKPRQISNE